ncbi:MAG: UvrD-helicase domain-containing protein, partial [Giesbergeria sp.]
MSTPQLHPHSDAPQVLNPLDFPLHGSRLIEASAGTGKTWTIAALVLRLVLGHGGAQGHPQPLMPAQILVMTFTRAATRELSSRIRARLAQAAQCFRGQAPVPEGDPFLAALLLQYPPGPQREHAAWRLALAAEAMDEAAVFTIDAWCQRMLREHAVDSGQLAEEELSTDERSLQAQAVQDYWRQQCYGLTPAQFDAVARVWPHVDALHADLRKLLDADLPALAQPATLAQCLQAQAQQEQTLRAGWPPRVQALRDWLEVQLQQHKAHWDGRKIQAGRCTTWLDALQQW